MKVSNFEEIVEDVVDNLYLIIHNVPTLHIE